VYKNHRRVFAARRWTDERTGQLYVSIREADVLMLLDVDAACGPCCTFAVFDERSDAALRVPPKLDANGSAATGDEAIAACRGQRPNVACFIECDELVRSGELVPDLQIQVRAGTPLIDACILAQSTIVESRGAASGTRRREQDHHKKA
jgi:hypothetical protein